MRKILTAALAALTIGGAVTATATTADAAPFGGGHFGYHGGYGRGYGPGLAVGAGLLGLAVGASLAQPAYGYGPGYYGGPAYAYGAPCRVHYRFDPYTGRSFPVERCY